MGGFIRKLTSLGLDDVELACDEASLLGLILSLSRSSFLIPSLSACFSLGDMSPLAGDVLS